MHLGPAHPALTGIRVHQSFCVCCCIWSDRWINLQIPGQPVASWMHRLFVRQRKANVKVTMKRWKTQEPSVNKEGHSETWSKPLHKLPGENTPRILITIRYFQWVLPSLNTSQKPLQWCLLFLQSWQKNAKFSGNAAISGVFSFCANEHKSRHKTEATQIRPSPEHRGRTASGGEQMWGGQDKGSPIWCLLDKAAES